MLPFFCSCQKAWLSRSRGPEFHGLQHRLADRCFRPHAVVLQVAVAVLVDQDAAFAAAALGQQDAGAGQSGRVVLHELHVLQRHAGPVGHGHAVAGLDRAVGGEGKHLAGATGGQHDGRRLEAEEPPAAHFHRHHAAAAAVLVQQFEGEELVESLDRRELHGGLEQRVQDVEAALVGGVPGAFLFHAAERPHGDRAVVLAAPGAAPVLQLHQFERRLLDEVLHHVLVAQPVAAADGVVEVHLQRIVGALDAGRAALGCAGVAAHRVDLGDQRDLQVRVGLGNGDRRPEAGAAGADDDHISVDGFHRFASELVCPGGGYQPEIVVGGAFAQQQHIGQRIRVPRRPGPSRGSSARRFRPPA